MHDGLESFELGIEFFDAKLYYKVPLLVFEEMFLGVFVFGTQHGISISKAVILSDYLVIPLLENLDPVDEIRMN